MEGYQIDVLVEIKSNVISLLVPKNCSAYFWFPVIGIFLSIFCAAIWVVKTQSSIEFQN